MVQDRLLDIAISVFGSAGLEGASTRQIARAADTAMSAITYHYGSKERLYLAAADRIADGLREEMRGLLDEAVALPQGDRPAATLLLHRIFERLADRMLSDR